ncbi:MAG: carotenoid oxygenase family protein [Nevskia sp.]|nr:carotenoid oxygenase family protein [Nevskia sp.]
MKAKLVNRVHSTIDPADPHPYLHGAWTPMFEEWDADALDVEGSLPMDLDGVYLRNSENPVHQPLGKYHPFDGDGMLHAIRFRGGRASYRNRFVRTAGFLAEQNAGRALWSGLAEMPPRSERPGWGAQGALKDSSSTDVVVHAGRALTSFYQCGELYQLDPQTLQQFGPAKWEGEGGFPAEGVSAHAKVDTTTGELLFFNYSKQAPYMHCGVVSAEGRLHHYRPVPLPGPRLPHDMAYTRHFMILCDFPLFWDAALLPKGLHVARMHDLPSRFALVPRPGTDIDPDIRWFEAAPTYALHFVNAWEDGDEVILDGYRQRCPLPPPLEGAPKPYAMLMAYTDLHSLKPQLWRWRFDLARGTTREEPLDEGVTEFGTFNRNHAMHPHRYVYSALGEHGMFLFNGLCKHDLRTGNNQPVLFGPGIYGSEAPFAPRPGGNAEDDGYLVSFVTDLNRDCSECWVYAAQDLAAGPIAKVRLPARIPSGTHACWTPGSALRHSE